ncbi:MAG: alpha/beta hydrolase [Hyphomicrobiales bacterium]|nr:alpha/beta hydrolase [Hyphomicrobiales bacterium]
MMTDAGPSAGFFESQGLRLHYVDWGNTGAPPLVLVHGGRDHCRSWDTLARALAPHFHVVAPDLRGHGDSEWAKGSSYSLADYVYDLSRLLAHLELDRVILVGHSMGGMVSLVYAGTFPERVTRLAVLDGIVTYPGRTAPPIHEQIARWVGELDAIAARKPRRLPSIAEGAARMAAHNKRLTPEQALFLAGHALRQHAEGGFTWKFDEYQSARAPYRLSPDDHAALWARIDCPTLLMRAAESMLPDPEPALAYLRTARLVRIAGAGHWLHHDQPEAVLAELKAFLDIHS